MIKNVAVLLRISRDKGEDVDTLENHRRILTRLCKEKAYKPTLFEEIVSGASKVADRVQTNKMLSQLDQFDAVVCIAVDRLTRDMEYAAIVYKALEKADIPLITPEKTYTANDMLSFYLEALMATQEYKQITKRMKRGKVEEARKGNWSKGQAPIGYKMGDNKRLEIDEENAETVRLIFNLCEKGYGQVAIGTELSERGILTKRGNHYRPSGVRLILTSETYLGHTILNVKDGETIYVQDTHEPIISLEQFNKCQQLLKGRISGDLFARTRSRGKVLSSLKDLVFCNKCGGKLGFYVKANKVNLKSCCAKREGKTCTNSSVLDELLLEHFWLEMSEYETQLFDKYSQLQSAKEINLASMLVQELNVLKDKKKVLDGVFLRQRQGFEAGIYSIEEMKDKKTEYEQQVREFDLRIRELDQRIKLDDPKREMSNVEERLAKLKQRSEMSMEELNTFLKTIVHKVHYERNEFKEVSLQIEFKGL